VELPDLSQAIVIVHVIYARRLTVGTAVADVDLDSRRMASMPAHVTYSTNKRVAFDHLRDRIVLHRRPSRLGLRCRVRFLTE
jgi:preprotein translocase subunit SecA